MARKTCLSRVAFDTGVVESHCARAPVFAKVIREME
jgi:hypothetical protein